MGNIVRDSRLDLEYPPGTANLTYTFSHTQGNSIEELFTLNESSGILSTASIIDRDVLCLQKEVCQITLKVKVGPSPYYFYIINVHIDIMDINDHAPVFPEDEIVRAVPESAGPGDSIAVPVADDPDSPRYGIQEYALLRGGDSEFFALRSSTGVPGAENIYLNLNQSLDREVRDFYSVKIAAYDGGAPPKSGTITVNIHVLDVNDHDPKFSQGSYYVEVPENVPQYTEIVQVNATDPDQGLSGQVSSAKWVCCLWLYP